ncbi:MAG: PQQ-dependent sugar dehydrogenase [Verrucomicrobiota bacterium]
MKKLLILIPAALGAAGVPSSPAAFPKLALEMVADKKIPSPTCITSAMDGTNRLFIGDQRGKIFLLKNGVLQTQPFLDISALLVPEQTAYDERGLLGLAFHPRYEQAGQPGAGKFYVFYSAPSPNAPGTAALPVNSGSVLAEYQVSAANPDAADPASGRVLLSFDKPQFNHNGGQVAFGPDGLLYFSTGDGGSSNDNNAGHTGGSAARPTDNAGNAQDRTSWMGKIHRIDPLGTNGPGGQYGIPADNPFAGSAGLRQEIYAYGLRNPWRFSFDRQDGRLFCADVGQGDVEEVDLITRGSNYGWRNREGSFFPAFSAGAPALEGTVVDPIAQYAHPGVVKGTPPLPQFGVSITGGALYRGTAIPALQGKYVFGDYSQTTTTPKGILLGLEESGGAWSLSQLDVAGGNPLNTFIQTFGEGEDGEIYVGTKLTRGPSELSGGLPAGSLMKVVAGPAPADFIVTATGSESDYTINGKGSSPALTLVRGRSYTFDITACTCHPLLIEGAPAESVINNNIANGRITFHVPLTAANYTYICSIHLFGGTITTVAPPAPSPIEAWRQSHFGSTGNTGDAADLADPDHDGLPNLVEFAFDQNPKSGASLTLPPGRLENGNFVVSFAQPAGISGITYTAEWSANPAAGGWTAVSDTGTLPQHLFSLPSGNNQRLFVRFRISAP